MNTSPMAILELPKRATYDGLMVAQRSWSREVAESAPVVEAIATGDYDAVIEALGTPESVTLTRDGHGAAPGSWCECRPTEAMPVRYERWTAEGRVSHGYVCPHIGCRKLVQSG